MSRALGRRGTWIGWVFFADLGKALALTFGYMFSRPVTMQYPDKEKWLPYSRYRGHHFLKRDEEGEIKCVACELCARICPCYCIEVVPYEDEKGNRRPITRSREEKLENSYCWPSAIASAGQASSHRPQNRHRAISISNFAGRRLPFSSS
jgi:ferredoxin